MKLESGKNPDTGSGVTYAPVEVNTSMSYASAPATGDHTQTTLPLVEALGAHVDLPSFTGGVEQRLGVGDGLFVGVGDLVGVGDGDFVGVGDGLLVGVGEGERVGVGDGDAVGVGDGDKVGVGESVGEGDGVGNEKVNVQACEGTPSNAPGCVGASDC